MRGGTNWSEYEQADYAASRCEDCTEKAAQRGVAFGFVVRACLRVRIEIVAVADIDERLAPIGDRLQLTMVSAAVAKATCALWRTSAGPCNPVGATMIS